MELQYLGTAAAEGFPGIFCDCDTCRKARKAGGKNIRTRSQAIIDKSLLIDFPADTLYHVYKYRLEMHKIQNCIVTHSHSDHFYPADLEMRREGYANGCTGTFNIYGTEIVKKAADEQIKQYSLDRDSRVAAYAVKPFEAFTIDKYTIIPLPADHDKKSGPVIYLISDGKSTLLYAHDTGLLSDEVMNWFKNSKVHIDFISADCTAGLLKGWTSGHLGLDTCVTLVAGLKNTGAVNDGTRICLNHFSHNCLADYDDMVTAAKEYGFDVSYDGMTVEF